MQCGREKTDLLVVKTCEYNSVMNRIGLWIGRVKNLFFPTYGGTLQVNITKAKRSNGKAKIPSMANPDSSHAREAIQKMINNAEEQIYVLCHKLGADIYDDFNTIRALDAAYKRNKNLDVRFYIRGRAPRESAFLTILIEQDAKIFDNLEKEEELKNILEDKDIFCIDRGRAIRRELNEDKKQAEIFFEDEKVKAETLEMFDKLAKKLTEKEGIIK